MKEETAEEMRERIQKQSFWRSLFWQGEYGAGEVTEMDMAALHAMVALNRQQYSALVSEPIFILHPPKARENKP
jgi:hypothetical protein